MAQQFFVSDETTTDVLVVNDLERWNDVERAIRAMEHLGANHVLRIAGDGPRRLSLEGLAETTGIADRIIFVGRVHDAEIDALMRRSDVLCSLSMRPRDHLPVRRAISAGLGTVISPSGRWASGRRSWVQPEIVTNIASDAVIAARIRRAANGAAKHQIDFGRSSDDRVVDALARTA